MTSNRPSYEPIIYSRAVNVSPEHLATLNQARLPKVPWGIGKMLEEPVGVDVPGHGYLIRIAVGFHRGVYVDPRTGEVLVMRDLDWPVPTDLQPLGLVNSSLQQFTRTQQAIIDAFPFADGVSERIRALDIDDAQRIAAEERDIDQRFATACKLRERIHEIDPVAMNPHSFWENFTFDVEIEDFSDVVTDDSSTVTVVEGD
jgi:hypothetical protein